MCRFCRFKSIEELVSNRLQEGGSGQKAAGFGWLHGVAEMMRHRTEAVFCKWFCGSAAADKSMPMEKRLSEKWFGQAFEVLQTPASGFEKVLSVS